MKKNYVLAIDQGTTSTRAVIYDLKGKMLGIAQKEITQYFPQSGWVEHDANEIWMTTLAVMSQVVKQHDIDPASVACIGITNQRETTVIWDKQTGQPIHHAVVWQSRQSEAICDKLKDEGLEQWFKDKTGLIIDPYFSATKVVWLLEHVKGAKKRALNGELLFGTIDSWLIWKLTNGKAHVTEPSNASRTMMYNIHNMCWDQDILTKLDIPVSLLPTVFPSSGLFGYTADFHFFGYEVPITGVLGDQQAALFGQGCFSPGDVKNTYGTGCFLLMNTGHKAVQSQKGLITTIAWEMNQEVVYALEGSVFVAGSAIQWLRDGLRMIDSAEETGVYASRCASSNGVYVVPAFVGLGAPYWDSDARGAIFGLTRGTTKEHLIRATLESIAFQSKEVIDVMVEESGLCLSTLKVDGGATRSEFLMQFQSDVLDCVIDVASMIETTALGAALVAAFGAHLIGSMDDLMHMRQTRLLLKPHMSQEEREALIKGWYQAVQATLCFK